MSNSCSPMAHLPFLILLLALLPLHRVCSISPSSLLRWSGPHIADLNVLLPPRMTNAVQYRLVGSGGCFTWTWDHHDILSVEPEYDSVGCSTSARLTSIQSYGGRKETSVYAADVNTRTVIRCEVFIDKIARIQIFHHSVKLDLDGLTELRIRAFDDKDNVFSSLVGLRFKWILIPNATGSDILLHHLVHVPLKETPLSDCGGFCRDLDAQIKLEDSGVGSDLYVVKGLKIGQEIVTAQLLEPQLEHLADKIVLTVAELMSLDPPSPVFVIVDTLVSYKLKVIRQHAPKAIDLPSPYHRWFASNTSVATVDLSMGTVTANNLGTTNVIVEDIRVSGHRQVSVMHVVIPKRLCLYMRPVTDAFNPLEGGVREYSSLDVWYVIAGQHYIVDFRAFSCKPEEKEIFLTQNNVLELKSDGFEYWSLLSIDRIGRPNSQLLKPHTKGQGTIAASLNYRGGMMEMIEVLKVEQLVIVCDKISIHVELEEGVLTEVVYLPWAPGVHQTLELRATGGCAKTTKDYKWHSSDEGIVSLSTSGIMRAEHPGLAVVKVASVYDAHNYAEVAVEVSVPSSMVMLPYFPVEIMVGDGLHAAVSLNSPNGGYYQRCDAFVSVIKWKIFHEGECFRIGNASTLLGLRRPSNTNGVVTVYGPACSWIDVYSFCSGRANLYSTFSSDMTPTFTGQIFLQATKTIASYSPLHARQAGDGNQFGGYSVDVGKAGSIFHDDGLRNLKELYLTPGTMIDILVLGGPERWGQEIEFIDELNVSRIDEENQQIDEENQFLQDKVLQKHSPVDGGRLFTVRCKTVGNYRLVFSRGNLAGPDHFLPTVDSLDLDLQCAFPSMISLIVNQFANTHELIHSSIQEPRGSGNIHLSPVSVANGQTIRIAAVGIHRSGNAFTNSSSLHLRWELSGCEGLVCWEEDLSGRSVIEWEKYLVLKNTTGQCVVRATIVGLHEAASDFLSEKAHALFHRTEIGVSDAVKLQLVSSLRVVPEKALLVFYPNAMLNMSIVGGTCFLDASLNDTKVTEIMHHPKPAECSILTLLARGIGTSLLTIYDKGLSPPASAVAMVKVATVDWIKIIPEDQIFLLEGSTKQFDLLAGTEDGSTFHRSQYLYMNIRLHADGHILKVVDGGSARVSMYRPDQSSFEVKAENIGIATLYVSLHGHSGNWITSKHVPVEVYPALRIRPDFIFLAPGAAYMIVVDGGPTSQTAVEFSSFNPDVAVLNKSSGLLSAISVGNTTIRVVSYGNDGNIICETHGRAEVGIPPTMILSAQSEQLCIGCELPLYPSYPEGNLFSFYEICNGYKWSIEDEKVLSFKLLQSWDYGLEMHPARSPEKFSHDSTEEELGFLNMVSGRSAGITNVSVAFSCDFMVSGTHVVTSYIAWRMLRVVHDLPLALGIPITWVLPPHYTTSDVLPEYLESSGQKDSRFHRKSVVYSVLKSCENNNIAHEDPIAVVDNKIKTRESNILGCLQAKDQSGRTEIACCIRVAKVSQVRISLNGPSCVVRLGVNDQLVVNASFFDYLGIPFLEAHGVVSLDTEINYHNVVSIRMYSDKEYGIYSKGQFSLQALKPGKALVRVFLKGTPQKAAYIMVFVGAQLLPQNPVLHVGEFLNFSVVGAGSIGTMQRRWLSSNNSVISIDRFTGRAHARAAGNANVHFESSSMKLKTAAMVLEDEHIRVHAPTETLTNVDFPSDGYMFPVDLSRTLLYKGDDNMIDCWVEPPFIGYAKPWKDHVAGVFYCVFFPYPPKHLVNLASKVNSTKRFFTDIGGRFGYISVFASLREAQNVVGSAYAPFVGGFSVSADTLDFTTRHNRSRMILQGNTDVQITWREKDLLSVIPVLKNDFGVGAHVEYDVCVTKRRRFKDKISIILPTIGQFVELDVTYDPGDEIMDAEHSIATWAAVVVSLLMLAWTVIVFVRFFGRPDSSHVEQSTPPQPSPTSRSALIVPESTPSPIRTPQPLMEHVRRTIDETPYYKRSGQRLFDPRNSY